MSRDPRIGTRLGPYRIERELGRGGMGVVYLAEHVHLERPVALKVLSDQLANDPAFRERFVRESRMAARLHHPNIIPVYDAGEQDGVLFIAMQYVDGSNLSALLDGGPLDPATALEVLEGIASALDEAHANGIVHRDVKPANIVLGLERGPGVRQEVYLTDFGLVREIERRSRLTQTGYFVGTLDYAAPEMFQNRDVDARSDQYSFACMLYECLTGDVPFPRDSEAALIAAHLTEAPPRPSLSRSGLPAVLDDVLARGMAKGPEARFASCSDLIRAARDAMAGAVAGWAGSPTIVTAGAGSPQPPAPGADRAPPSPTGAGVAPPPPTGATAGPPPPRPAGSPTTGAGGPNGPARRRGRLVAAAVVVAIALVVGIVALATSGSKSPSATSTTAGPGATTAPPTVASTSAPAGSSSATNGPTAATGPTGSPVPTLVHPRVEAAVGVGELPFGVARDATSVWVANKGSGTVSRIDPVTHKVLATRQGVPNAFEIASGLGSIWVTDQRQTLFRLGPGGSAPERIRLQGGAFGVTIGFGSVWVTNDQSDTVTRLDANGKILARISTGHLPHGLTAGADSIWIAGDTGSVTRVDPATNKVSKTIEVPTGSAFQVAEEAGFIWVTNGLTALIEIDPATNTVVKAIPTKGGSFAVIGGFGSVWVTNANANTLSRVDVAQRRVVDVLAVDVSPRLMAVGPEGLWVVNGDSANVFLVHP